MRLIIATHNEAKVREMSAMLDGLGLDLLSLADVGLHEEIVEDGDSFSANARIKAAYAHAHCPGDWVMADDSGLCVDALDGGPGIHSARFAGYASSYGDKMEALQAALRDAGARDRRARFISAIVAISPEGEELCVEGVLEGEIAHAPRGSGGFGYDPIFYLPTVGMTTAELDPAVKNRISHRGRAVAAMRSLLAARLRGDD